MRHRFRYIFSFCSKFLKQNRKSLQHAALLVLSSSKSKCIRETWRHGYTVCQWVNVDSDYWGKGYYLYKNLLLYYNKTCKVMVLSLPKNTFRVRVLPLQKHLLHYLYQNAFGVKGTTLPKILIFRVNYLHPKNYI